MTRELGIRTAIVYVPMALAIAMWLWRRPGRQAGAGVLLAVVWNLWALTLIHLVAVRAGWWRYNMSGPDLLGLPADVLIGWTVWWGAVAALVPARLLLVITGAAAVDLVAMPAAAPVVRLGPAWLIGEGLALVLCLVPGLLLARWTATGRRLTGRIVLQVVGATGVMVGLVLCVGAELRGLDVRHVVDRPPFANAALTSFLLLFALLALTAVREFGERGRGTPVPYDPPRRLVTTGPYAYVRNPMQVGMLGMYAILAVLLWTPWLLVAVVIGVAYSVGLASWHEDAELVERFGERWTRHKARVRPWRPRWRLAMQDSPARLYVAATCVACSSLGRWFETRHPVSLELRAAEDAPELRCERLTYLGPDGYRTEGVAALARALEHLNLAWAVTAWVLRLPVLCGLVQLIGDAVGAGPRPAWKASEALACDRAVRPGRGLVESG